jgi:FixJ family two-component response regulator
MSPPDATVFVVDDQPGIRKSLQFLMESAGLKIEAYGSAEEFLKLYEPTRQGCLVLDVYMPGMTGVQLLETLAEHGDFRPAIVITGRGDVATAVRAMKAGAIDFLEKPFDDHQLLEKVQICMELDARWRGWRSQAVEIVRRLDSLTPREREVLDLVVEGHPTKEIAERLSLSPHTIEIHRHHIMSKMQARSSIDLVRMTSLCRNRVGTM